MSENIEANGVIELLKKIKDPEFGVSIVELGLVDGLDVEGGCVTVFVNFNRSLPSCKSCVPLAWMVLRAILREMERALKGAGVRYRIVEKSSGVVYLEG